MALTEKTGFVSVDVNVASGVAAALPNRFVVWDSNAGRVITLVPAATGAFADGILAEEVDATIDGVKTAAMLMPGPVIGKVLLGEAVVTVGSTLRAGGNGAEVDGAAYLADATGDIAIAKALEVGGIGAIISVSFPGFIRVTP